MRIVPLSQKILRTAKGESFTPVWQIIKKQARKLTLSNPLGWRLEGARELFYTSELRRMSNQGLAAEARRLFVNDPGVPLDNLEKPLEQLIAKLSDPTSTFDLNFYLCNIPAWPSNFRKMLVSPSTRPEVKEVTKPQLVAAEKAKCLVREIAIRWNRVV